MKTITNNEEETQNQYLQGFDDSIIIAYLTLAQIQPSISTPLILLIKKRGTSPPGCTDSPGTGYCLSPDIQPVISKWKNIKN
jgi:hypothetical protein